MKETLCQCNSTDFNGFLLDASVDLLLIDMGRRAKIRCSVSNCYSHTLTWSMHSAFRTVSPPSTPEATWQSKWQGREGGLVNESSDCVKRSTDTVDSPNVPFILKDKDKKEIKTYSCALWTFWVLTCTLHLLQLLKRSRAQVLPPQSADKTIKWKVAIFTQCFFIINYRTVSLRTTLMH